MQGQLIRLRAKVIMRGSALAWEREDRRRLLDAIPALPEHEAGARREVFRPVPPSPDRLAAFVVAHLNIADCYADMGQPSSAAECLSCAHHKLMALLHGDTVPESLQIAASRQLHQTYAALSEHRAKHGEHPLVERALNACRAHMPVPGALLH